jgi:hypothetical protein
MHWHRPARFRQVCPLLVTTPQGLRCSANAADVRPFWMRAAAWFGGTALAIYLAGAICVFVFLRIVGYPVNIFHVVLPPLWHRVTESRSWYFLNKSNLAFASDRVSEGLLYLTNAYEFDRNNYAAGISLAKHLQAGQPARSDVIFQQLIQDHPAHRNSTAQEWFRALLARGSYARIALLARDEIIAGSPHSAVWLRALVFSARRLPSDQFLRELRASPEPRLKGWRPIFEIESHLRTRAHREARALLDATWTAPNPAFGLYYRVSVLSELRDTFAAIDLLGRHPNLLDSEAAFTLRLDALAAGRMQRSLQQEVDRLLATPLTSASQSVVKILCAHLIRFPNPAIFERLALKATQEKLPLQTETAGIWFSLFCAAGAVGDRARLHELTARLRHASEKPFMALSAVEAFFRGETSERRITTFLPLLPLPLEVTYALHERYPPPGPLVSPLARP